MDSISGINNYNRVPIKEPTSNPEKDKEDKKATLESDKEKEVLKTDADQRSLRENEVLLKVGTAMLKEAMHVEGDAVLSLLQSMGLGTNVDLQA